MNKFLMISIYKIMNINLKFNSLTQYRTLITQATPKLAVRTTVNLSFEIMGGGPADPDEPPIFLLHGLLGNKIGWKSIGKTILNMTKRTVVVLDLRNHGRSPHVSSHKYDEMAADIIQLLDKLEVKKASLVGHNIGGRTAMCTALMAPKRVAGLIVVDISPVSNPRHLKDMYKLLKAMRGVDFKNLKQVCDAITEAKKQLKSLIDDETTMTSVMSNINIQGGKIGWTCNLDVLIKQFQFIESFPISLLKGKKYDGPCLFIGGQLSDYIPADDLNSIRELFTQAVITYIHKAGHNLHAQDTRPFLEITIDFLKTHT